MPYFGTTAASSVQNPPSQIARPVYSGARLGSTGVTLGLGLWVLGTTDPSSSPFTANYISDAQALGMKQGDIVFIVGQTSTVASSQTLSMGVVGAVSTAGTQLSTFSFISST